MKRLCLAVVLLSACVVAFAADTVNFIGPSATVIQDVMEAPYGGIPRELLATTRCMVIIPSIQGAGLVVGGRYGFGLATCRSSQQPGWTGPSAVKIDGGRFGLQVYGGPSDLIMLIMSDTAVYRLTKGPLTLGTGTALAGTMGRCSFPEPDAFRCDDIIAFPRLRGEFTEMDLYVAIIQPLDGINESIYGRKVSNEDILSGRVPIPASASPLVNLIAQYSTPGR
jgi:lipid-binding SYLF domain-containing protein